MSNGRRERRKQFIKDRNQRLRALDKKQWDIHDEMRNLEWIDLPEPMFVGYKRTLELRDDYTRRKDADFYYELLEVVQNDLKCRRKNFTFKCNKTHKWVEHKLYPKVLTHAQFNKLTDRMKRMFYAMEDYRTGKRSYHLIAKFCFVVRTDKNYVTRVKGYNGELVSKYTEIENYMETNGYQNFLNKLHGWGKHYSSYYHCQAIVNKCKKKDVQRDLNDLGLDYDYRLSL
jgi:hypothetical protein